MAQMSACLALSPRKICGLQLSQFDVSHWQKGIPADLDAHVTMLSLVRGVNIVGRGNNIIRTIIIKENFLN